MPSISPRLTAIYPGVAICAVALLMCACQNVPKYKKTNGKKFDEWGSYEGRHFEPSNGTVAAVDPAANTVTILQGRDTKVFTLSPATRIIHEGTNIPLAQLPLQQQVKFTLSDDGKQLLTIWYGERLYTFHIPHPGQQTQNRP